jgi:hypothetical protein
MHTSFEPILSDRDKMPFEVTPVYLKLSYFKSPTAPTAAPAAASPATPANPPVDAAPQAAPTTQP